MSSWQTIERASPCRVRPGGDLADIQGPSLERHLVDIEAILRVDRFGAVFSDPSAGDDLDNGLFQGVGPDREVSLRVRREIQELPLELVATSVVVAYWVMESRLRTGSGI